MEKLKILVVDDDTELRTQMVWALNPNYDVLLAEDRPSAIQMVKDHKPAAVMLDLGLPPSVRDNREGFRALADMLQIDRFLKVLVVTEQDEKQNGIEAIAQGAYDFFGKPVHIDELKIVLERAIRIQDLERSRLEQLSNDYSLDGFEEIIGVSPQIQSVFDTVQKVSCTDASVLIVGESGTGKELVAQAIHRRSSRKSGPFVPINCGAIPENLLESELFGHEKGSFTGAHIQRQGRVELANGGTLFLDEIGELSGQLQVKLLRFLQQHEIERIGGRSPIRIDARIVAATNMDLSKAMAEGRFREDLYYRLGVVIISLPSLRERSEDVLLLANTFLQRHANAQGRNLAFTAKALEAIQFHQWPGNVRELENRIQRAAIMAENGRVMPKDLGISHYSEFEGQGLAKARQAVERQIIKAALTRNKGNMTRAAAQLEISRPSLYELIDKLGIARP